MTIFISGGMPRSSHGDKYTVSVMKTVEDRGNLAPMAYYKNKTYVINCRGKSCLLRADIENYRFFAD